MFARWSACISLFLSAISAATEFRLIEDFREVAIAVESYANQFGPQGVLLVVDVDNTLLAMDESLGSEQWFDWQVYLLKNEPDSRHLVANSFPGILRTQGRLYDRGGMHPPQPDLPDIVEQIQMEGVPAIVLTSRGEDFRPATERELARNGFNFARSALPTRDRLDSQYMPYDPARPTAAGIDAREVSALKLQKPQQVSYANGIMMTSGQHKGIMLVTLMHRSALPIKAVVFVDNRADHVAGAYDQMREEGLESSGLVYQREDDNIKAFLYGSKDGVSAEWRQLNQDSDSKSTEVQTPFNTRNRFLTRRFLCR